MSHLVPQLRHRVVVGTNLVIRRALLELANVKSDIVIAPDWRSLRRPFLHLVRSHIYRLDVLPLEPALGAIGFQVVLVLASSQHVATFRPVAGSTRLLVINAEIGVVSKEVKFVAERLDHGARQILRPRQRQVMERFVEDWKRTIFVGQRRKMDFGVLDSGQTYLLWGQAGNRLTISRCNDFGRDKTLLNAAQFRR